MGGVCDCSQRLQCAVPRLAPSAGPTQRPTGSTISVISTISINNNIYNINYIKGSIESALSSVLIEEDIQATCFVG